MWGPPKRDVYIWNQLIMNTYYMHTQYCTDVNPWSDPNPKSSKFHNVQTHTELLPTLSTIPNYFPIFNIRQFLNFIHDRSYCLCKIMFLLIRLPTLPYDLKRVNYIVSPFVLDSISVVYYLIWMSNRAISIIYTSLLALNFLN